jgi:hypothetical protein
MTGWEKKIIDACINHYFAHAPAGEDTRNVLRIRSSIFFPDFDTAAPDEKESYLEAAESLERKGIIKLVWEKHRKGQRLKTLSCEHFEKIFDEAGRSFPKTEAAKIRATLKDKAAALRNSPDALNNETAQNTIALLEFLSANFGPHEIGQGIDQQAIEELIRFLEFSFERSRLESITIRALSILLYSDSKRLESLLNLCAPFFARAQKNFLHYVSPRRETSICCLGGNFLKRLSPAKLLFISTTHRLQWSIPKLILWAFLLKARKKLKAYSLFHIKKKKRY